MQKELRREIQEGKTATGRRWRTSCSRATSVDPKKALKPSQDRRNGMLRLQGIRGGLAIFH